MIVQYFEKNTQGRDFVIGDLHGCIDDFKYVLNKLNFDKTRDRMFSVGDLVDRGPNSLACLDLLQEDWFHAVVGNHEMLFHDSVESWNDDAHEVVFKKAWSVSTWMTNGGLWIEDSHQMKNMNNALLQKYLEAIKGLPSIIRLSGYNKKINITHAEMYSTLVDLSDEFIDDLNNMENHLSTSANGGDISNNNYDLFELLSNIKQSCAWGRRVVKNANGTSKVDIEDLTLLDQLVVCGHTVVDNPCVYKNHLFIDGGACFKNDNFGFTRKLMVYNCQTEEVIVFPLSSQALQENNSCW